MAVKMRLTRMGDKKNPFYRIVVADSRKSRDGEYVDLVGTYNPLKNPEEIKIDNEKAKCTFEPIRIETNGDKFISSGRFNNITSHDRIALVQYCFRKQIENSNK